MSLKQVEDQVILKIIKIIIQRGKFVWNHTS